MSTVEKDVAREQSALPNDFRGHGLCMLHLRIWRMADGDHGRTASNSEETGNQQTCRK